MTKYPGLPKPSASDPKTLNDVDAIIEYLEYQITGRTAQDEMHNAKNEPEDDPVDSYDRAMKGL